MRAVGVSFVVLLGCHCLCTSAEPIGQERTRREINEAVVKASDSDLSTSQFDISDEQSRKINTEEKIKGAQWDIFSRVLKALGPPTTHERGEEIYNTVVTGRDCDAIKLLRQAYTKRETMKRFLAGLYAPLHCVGDDVMRNGKLTRTFSFLRKGFSRKNTEQEIKDFQWTVFEHVLKTVGPPKSVQRTENAENKLLEARDCGAARSLQDKYSRKSEPFKRAILSIYFPLHCLGEDLVSTMGKKTLKTNQ